MCSFVLCIFQKGANKRGSTAGNKRGAKKKKKGDSEDDEEEDTKSKKKGGKAKTPTKGKGAKAKPKSKEEEDEDDDLNEEEVEDEEIDDEEVEEEEEDEEEETVNDGNVKTPKEFSVSTIFVQSETFSEQSVYVLMLRVSVRSVCCLEIRFQQHRRPTYMEDRRESPTSKIRSLRTRRKNVV